MARLAPSLTESDLGLLSSCWPAPPRRWPSPSRCTLILGCALGGGTLARHRQGRLRRARRARAHRLRRLRHAPRRAGLSRPQRLAARRRIRNPAAAASGDQRRPRNPDRTAHRPQPDAGEDRSRSPPTDDGRRCCAARCRWIFAPRTARLILNLPGQAQHAFKLRLAAHPSRSTHFGPWLLVDRVVSTTAGRCWRHVAPNDGYAIRYSGDLSAASCCNQDGSARRAPAACRNSRP